MVSKQAGNAIIIILIAVFLFGALAATFMRGSRTGTGNLTAQQAQLAAQELLNFFNVVERTANKLRSQGCSENDISFSSANDAGTFIADNDSVTAPVDKSCHVFDAAGGNLNMNQEFEKYQLPYDSIDAAGQVNHGQAWFHIPIARIVGIGTNANDLMIQLNYVNPQICAAYNKILKHDIDLTVPDGGAPTGDENLDLANKYTYCYYRNPALNFYQIRYVWAAR